MRRFTLTTLLVALAFLATALECAAATFTSTAGGGVGVNDEGVALRISSSAAALNQTVRGHLQYRPVLTAGSSPVDLSVDTTTDKATVTGIAFFVAANAGPQMFGDTFDVDVEVQVTPPNFPDPPVFDTVQGTYEERLTITGTTATAPTFVSSGMGSIIYNSGAGHFDSAPVVTLVTPDITVFGTYEAIGPTTSISQPFSIVFKPIANTRQAQFAIPGGPGFGNGFAFDPYRMTVDYRPVNSNVFNGTVDSVTFSVSVADLSVNYFVPEPGSLSLVGAGVAAAMTTVRRRR